MLNAIRKFFSNPLASVNFAPVISSQPIPVSDILSRPLPEGFYRLRNGGRARVKFEDGALVRAFGCEMPSAISLRWKPDGRYVSGWKEHPFDLVEFEGER